MGRLPISTASVSRVPTHHRLLFSNGTPGMGVRDKEFHLRRLSGTAFCQDCMELRKP